MKEHPVLLVAGMLVLTMLTSGHIVGAAEYLKKNDRGWFEGITLLLGATLLWPLFSVGMMFRGYVDFWKKTWGKDG